MTIALMMRDNTTRLPRPYSRACSQAELREMLDTAARALAGWTPEHTDRQLHLERRDTDDPVLTVTLSSTTVAFFAFTEV